MEKWRQAEVGGIETGNGFLARINNNAPAD
jgi:hypothetical protein